MIDRYDVEEISSIWRDENKFSKYLIVEKALLHGLKDDYPTKSALEKIALVEIKAVSPFKSEAVKIAGPDLGPVSKRGRTSINVVPF